MLVALLAEGAVLPPIYRAYQPLPSPGRWHLQLAKTLGYFHVVCGGMAATVSSGRGEQWVPRFAKVMAVGFLALVEVVLVPQDASQRGA